MKNSLPSLLKSDRTSQRNLRSRMAGSYPMDYDPANNKIGYLVGMSVPPVMMAQIATRIYKQWLFKL